MAAAILGVLAIAALVVAVRLPPSPARGPTGPELLVPGWSARRLPLALADTIGELQLPTRVRQALGDTRSCFILRRGGSTVFEQHPTRPLTPASTQKLLTAVAALEVLGPQHRFRTRVVARTDPRNGTLARLWLVGGADPVLMVRDYQTFLSTEPLTRGHPATLLGDLADRIVRAGVRKVTAGVVGDASRHAGARVVPSWPSRYLDEHDISYLSALTVNGGWSAWDPKHVTAPDPAVYAASELTRLLTDRGVTVGAAPTRGVAPDGATVVATVESPPLSDIVGAMLRESDNLIAETLTREVGLARKGEGTTAAGTAAVLEVDQGLGIDTTGVSLVDGSGLDRGNRATCRAILGALALRTRHRFSAIDAGLAVAGVSGTLAERMEGPRLEGRLRAKTGSLRGVVGLAGVLKRPPPATGSARPADLSFAMIANGGFSAAGGGRLQDRAAGVVRSYPFVTDPEVLAPPPARSHRATTH